MEIKSKPLLAWHKAHPERIKENNRAWSKAHPDRRKEINRLSRYRHGAKPMSENKSSSLYLGCVIAETVLAHEFPGFEKMSYGNKGFDYKCPQGFLIDVKSSCRIHPKQGNDFWHFCIRKNKKANYFLLLAFDDRESLTPEHIWLIPGNEINEKICFGITNSSKPLAKWSSYERSLENVINCCNKLRGD